MKTGRRQKPARRRARSPAPCPRSTRAGKWRRFDRCAGGYPRTRRPRASRRPTAPASATTAPTRRLGFAALDFARIGKFRAHVAGLGRHSDLDDRRRPKASLVMSGAGKGVSGRLRASWLRKLYLDLHPGLQPVTNVYIEYSEVVPAMNNRLRLVPPNTTLATIQGSGFCQSARRRAHRRVRPRRCSSRCALRCRRESRRTAPRCILQRLHRLTMTCRRNRPGIGGYDGGRLQRGWRQCRRRRAATRRAKTRVRSA